MSEPVRVLITGAAGQIAYSLLYMVSSGEVFGKDRKIILHLLDIPPMMGVLEGVVMELHDCAFPLLHSVVPTTDVEVAFKDVDAAFLVGAMPRKEGMERKDLLASNVKIFKTQGSALDQFAKKTVKVLVVGNPANTNALVCSHFAPSVPKENFTAMTRLDQNRAQAQVALRLGLAVDQVSGVVIWGNHSSTQFPDVSQAQVVVNGVSKAVPDAIADEAYIQNDFVTTVQKRGQAVIAARKLSSAMSAARAASDHMRDWFLGSGGKVVSMGVYSTGAYGAPEGVVFSFPVTISDGQWKIVEGRPISESAKKRLEVTGKELCEERDEAMKATQD